MSRAILVRAQDLIMPKPVEVKALPDHRIWLRYDDGVSGEIDLSDMAGQGVFAAWNDPAVFKAVRLGAQGAIEWSPDLDLCPDAMYLRLTGKTFDEVFRGPTSVNA